LDLVYATVDAAAIRPLVEANLPVPAELPVHPDVAGKPLQQRRQREAATAKAVEALIEAQSPGAAAECSACPASVLSAPAARAKAGYLSAAHAAGRRSCSATASTPFGTYRR
jgi:hypothetical protein